MNRIKHPKNTVNLEIAEKLAAAAATAAAKAKGTPAELALRGVAVHAGNLAGHQAAARKVQDSVLTWHAKQSRLEMVRLEEHEQLDRMRADIAVLVERIEVCYGRPMDAVAVLAQELEITGSEYWALANVIHRLNRFLRYARDRDLTRQG